MSMVETKPAAAERRLVPAREFAPVESAHGKYRSLETFQLR